MNQYSVAVGKNINLISYHLSFNHLLKIRSQSSKIHSYLMRFKKSILEEIIDKEFKIDTTGHYREGKRALVTIIYLYLQEQHIIDEYTT